MHLQAWSKIGALLMVLALAMPALCTASVTRSMPSSAMNGSTINVSIAILLDGATYYAIDEVLPSTSWIVTSASNGGNYASESGHVKWLCFQNCQNITYSYNVTVPSAANGSYLFLGKWAMEGIDEMSIGGDTAISVTQPTPPSPPPSPPPGDGGGAGPPQPVVVIVQDAANLTISNVSANATIMWNLLQPSKMPFTKVNVTFVAVMNNVKLALQAYTSKPTGLGNISGIVYKWVGLTPTHDTTLISDANLSAVRIEFAVPNSWISDNSMNANDVALYRYSGTTPAKLTTSQLTEDGNWTYYAATSPGLSFFAIAGPPAECPECPADFETTCVAGTDGKGRKEVTIYSCGAATNYTCAAQTEEQFCCPECQAAGEWSACTNGQQSRTAYRCSTATDYKCEQYTETQSCVDAATASAAIARAEAAIASARQAGKDVATAETLLTQARAALNAGNYENAQNLAVQAESATELALPLPGPPLLPIAGIAAAAAGLGATGIFLMRRRKAVTPTKNVCVVCGDLTTLRTKCSSCGRYACIRHLQTIAGRPYCSNCVKKMYGRA